MRFFSLASAPFFFARRAFLAIFIEDDNYPAGTFELEIRNGAGPRVQNIANRFLRSRKKSSNV